MGSVHQKETLVGCLGFSVSFSDSLEKGEGLKMELMVNVVYLRKLP